VTAERGEARERVVGFFCQVRVCFAFVYRIFGTTTKDFGCELHKRRKSGGWKKSALEHTKPAKNETNAKRQRFKHTHTHIYIEYEIEKKRAPRATCRGKSSSPSLSHSTPELTSKGEISLHKVCVRATSEDLMDSTSSASFEEEEEGIVVVVVIIRCVCARCARARKRGE